MRCRECGEYMKSDIDEQRYICDCGAVIKWGGDRENGLRAG